MRLKHGLILAVGFLLIFALYHFYPVMLYKVMEWQKGFNQQLSSSLKLLGQNQTQAGLTLVLMSFLYGIFHAVGPGHGKFILTSYLALEQTKLKQAVKMSLSASLVQGVVAVLLVSVIVVLFTLSRRYFDVTLQWVERGGFAIMGAFGLYWCYQAIKSFKPKKLKIQAVHLQKIDKNQPLVLKSSGPHSHDEQCGCGHQHLPTSEQMQQGKDWRAQAMIILTIGARPCSGAILVLFLSYTLNLYHWGVLSAMVMAIGTGLTLAIFALLVLFARKKALNLSRWYVSDKREQQLSAGLKLALGVVLIAMALLLLHSSFIEVAPKGVFGR